MNVDVTGEVLDGRSLYRVGSVQTMGSPSRSSAGELVTIANTTTAAVVGDIFRAEMGNLAYLEIPVVSVPDANSFVIATKTLPTTSDTFYLLRKVTPRSDSAGSATSTPAVPAAVTVKQAAIAVGLTAVRLTTDGSAPSSTRVFLLANTEQTVTAKFYIGSSSVTSTGGTTGTVMNGGEGFSRINDAGDYYVISDTAAQTVYILEQE